MPGPASRWCRSARPRTDVSIESAKPVYPPAWPSGRPRPVPRIAIADLAVRGGDRPWNGDVAHIGDERRQRESRRPVGHRHDHQQRDRGHRPECHGAGAWRPHPGIGAPGAASGPGRDRWGAPTGSSTPHSTRPTPPATTRSRHRPGTRRRRRARPPEIPRPTRIVRRSRHSNPCSRTRITSTCGSGPRSISSRPDSGPTPAATSRNASSAPTPHDQAHELWHGLTRHQRPHRHGCAGDRRQADHHCGQRPVPERSAERQERDQRGSRRPPTCRRPGAGLGFRRVATAALLRPRDRRRGRPTPSNARRVPASGIATGSESSTRATTSAPARSPCSIAQRALPASASGSAVALSARTSTLRSASWRRSCTTSSPDRSVDDQCTDLSPSPSRHGRTPSISPAIAPGRPANSPPAWSDGPRHACVARLADAERRRDREPERGPDGATTPSPSRRPIGRAPRCRRRGRGRRSPPCPRTHRHPTSPS